MMRCKVGDLAVIIGGAYPENIGCLVSVVMLSTRPQYWLVRTLGRATTYNSVDGVRRNRPPGIEGNIADRLLRPLRDDPGPDESLRWASKPVGETSGKNRSIIPARV